MAENNKLIQLNAKELTGTVITPHLEYETSKDKNVMFCSTFQIAWNILSDEIIKKPVQLFGQPQMEKMLNKRLTKARDISKDYYIAMAGLGKDDIIGKIKKALKAKFNEETQLGLSVAKPEDFLAYAFLLKDIRFEKEFESLEKPILFKGNTSVRAFGIKKYSAGKNHGALRKQIDILDYKNDDDFIVALKSLSPEDEIVLAKTKPGKTLLDTVKAVFKRTKKKKLLYLTNDDTLGIPKMDFNILREYSEIEGRKLLNKGFTDHLISKAIQLIRFRLNEKGALLRSEAAVVSLSGAPQKPKHLVFDQPFLLYLKEKSGKYPYFAMWIDNAELLMQE